MPITTRGLPSLYSGAAFTWSRVSPRLIRSDLLPVGANRSAAPIDGNLSAADPEEAAEVDDRRAHLPAAVDHDVDHPPHVLPGTAEDLPAEDGLEALVVDNGCRCHTGSALGSADPLGDPLLAWQSIAIIGSGRSGSCSDTAAAVIATKIIRLSWRMAPLI